MRSNSDRGQPRVPAAQQRSAGSAASDALGGCRPFLPRGRYRGPGLGPRPRHPARAPPNSVDPSSCMAGRGSLTARRLQAAPRSRGARGIFFFSGKLSGSAGQSRGGQEKRSASGGCDHPGTSPRCEPSPSARVLPLRPPPHADAQAAAGPSPFALAAPCPPRPAGPQPGLGSPRGGDRGVRTRVRPAAGPGRGSLPRAQSLATCQASHPPHLLSAPKPEDPL